MVVEQKKALFNSQTGGNPKTFGYVRVAEIMLAVESDFSGISVSMTTFQCPLPQCLVRVIVHGILLPPLEHDFIVPTKPHASDKGENERETKESSNLHTSKSMTTSMRDSKALQNVNQKKFLTEKKNLSCMLKFCHTVCATAVVCFA